MNNFKLLFILRYFYSFVDKFLVKKSRVVYFQLMILAGEKCTDKIVVLQALIFSNVEKNNCNENYLKKSQILHSISILFLF